MTQHYLAWWNVENLFNVKNDPDHSEKLERALGGNWMAGQLQFWTRSWINSPQSSSR